MTTDNLTALSDQELKRKLKTIKSNIIIDALCIGFTIGIVIYSAVNSGFTFPTFFPLLLAYIIARNSKNNKTLELEIQKEITSRNLKY